MQKVRQEKTLKNSDRQGVAAVKEVPTVTVQEVDTRAPSTEQVAPISVAPRPPGFLLFVPVLVAIGAA